MVGNEEIDVADETDDVPYVEYDISVSPSDLSLELIAQKIENEDIIIPFYQRKYVWKIDQASKLIESFLMGLPVPQVFLYVNEEDQLEVIDGQQRLMSVKYFLEGYFDEPDALGKRRVFRLKGLSERSEYNGKLFSELSSRDQRRLRNSTLRAINIKQLSPKSGNDSVFHIFERLNTGGVRLKPQEIRNAVYRGAIVDALFELNEFPDWRSVLGSKHADKAQKDIELILRLFSLYQRWPSYEKPMLTFLNHSMRDNRGFSDSRAQSFVVDFKRACSIVAAKIDRPFRPRGLINASVLEATMLALMENPEIDGSDVDARYQRLLDDSRFQETIFSRTTDTEVVIERNRLASEILGHA